jgi:hypothetical protein
MSNFLGNMHTFMHMYMHDKNLIKTKLILLKHVEQLLLLIKHNVDTTWVCTYSALNCLFTNKEEN